MHVRHAQARSCSHVVYMNLKFPHKKHVKNNENTLERLDQGDLYPNLEVPGPTCPGREPGLTAWEVSTLEKS